MALLLPGVQVNLRRTSTPPNPQDLAAIPCVIGPSSAGPTNTVTTLTTLNDLAQFGDGIGIDHAADILNVAGGPVYYVRPNTTTPGTLSTVTKIYGHPVGTPVHLYGSVLIDGVDDNGDVLITAKTLGVSIQVIDPGAVTAATIVTVIGNSIQVTLKHDMAAITETGTGLAAAINGSVAAAALVTAAAQGTGASVTGPLASTSLDDGAININALTPGQSVRVLLSGANTALSTSYATNVVTITLATNAASEPTTTASAALASLATLALANPGVFSAALIGAGTKLLGAKTVTVMPFGSTGTVSVSGLPSDIYNFRVNILRGGAIGGPNPVTMEWTSDGVLYSSEIVIPASGIVLLKDSLLNTGVTVTFAGTFDVGDGFTFTSTGPAIGAVDLYAAIDVALNDNIHQFGYITSAVPIDRTIATVVDAKLQAARQKRNLYGLFTARNPNTGESDAAWQTSIINDFIGFVSQNGLLSITAGTVTNISTYTGRTTIRSLVISASSRASSIPVHEDLGCVASGPLRNVIAIQHDEDLQYGLYPQRFIVARTFSTRPGEFYVNASPTFSDPSDVGYTLLEWVRVTLSVARIASQNALIFVNSALDGIGQLDGTGAPLGAISVASAQKVQSYIESAVRAFLFKPKSDGQASASDAGKIVTVLRNYSFLATREIRLDIDLTPLGIAQKIIININVNIPA